MSDSTIRMKLDSLPATVVILGNHYYRLFDAAGNLVSMTGVTRPENFEIEILPTVGGTAPYFYELYIDPRPGDNNPGLTMAVTRREPSLSLYAHGHELSSEMVSNVGGVQRMLAKCSCGWKSAINEHDKAMGEYNRHVAQIDWSGFAKTVDE